MLGWPDFWIVVSFAAIGAGLKAVDLSFDEDLFSRRVALVLSIPGALLFAFTTLSDAQSATILIAVILGCLFARKIDNVAFVMGTAIVAVLFAALSAFSLILLAPLVALALFGILDELGNNFVDRKRLRGAAGFFLGHRFFMRFGMLAIALFGVFDWLHFAAFICLDAAYESIEAIFNR